ncbi:TPA: hypothetical protein N0F65_000400 [Lagenidium giganteum]|uniref:non-specific serine/threonine protein kinase n=1 Tax=Lagenidium giganteum TaxID=4803 RepID=A0AAV2Z3F4_9STRA|nr:TPA: hypothetical protein N0F65_000400 [Lagenidium giganteum]
MLNHAHGDHLDTQVPSFASEVLARDGFGVPVAWWAILKLPSHLRLANGSSQPQTTPCDCPAPDCTNVPTGSTVNTSSRASGLCYLYADARQPSFQHFRTLGYDCLGQGGNDPLSQTLLPQHQVPGDSERDDELYWAVFNDQLNGIAQGKEAANACGEGSAFNAHAKGAVAFNVSSRAGFFLQTSTPNFPDPTPALEIPPRNHWSAQATVAKRTATPTAQDMALPRMHGGRKRAPSSGCGESSARGWVQRPVSCSGDNPTATGHDMQRQAPRPDGATTALAHEPSSTIASSLADEPTGVRSARDNAATEAAGESERATATPRSQTARAGSTPSSRARDRFVRLGCQVDDNVKYAQHMMAMSLDLAALTTLGTHLQRARLCSSNQFAHLRNILTSANLRSHPVGPLLEVVDAWYGALVDRHVPVQNDSVSVEIGLLHPSIETSRSNSKSENVREQVLVTVKSPKSQVPPWALVSDALASDVSVASWWDDALGAPTICAGDDYSTTPEHKFCLADAAIPHVLSRAGKVQFNIENMLEARWEVRNETLLWRLVGGQALDGNHAKYGITSPHMVHQGQRQAGQAVIFGDLNSHADSSRPNLFQRNLCLHHKQPASTRYQLLHELGKGAFGVVEEVEHLKTKKHYAMKTVTFSTGSKRTEFEREIDILRGLHHPNIVRMVETFEDDHHFYIIMELCTGGTLLNTVKERKKEFPEEYVKDVIGKLASVIQYLHSRFICHRDLKLENILVESEEMGGGIKLCDFGASTLFRMGVSMRKVLGSVVYMAPEVLEGNYTESCDLWSLGVIMFMLLSNKAPFYGATEDELIEKIFEAKVMFDGEVWDSVSIEAKALIKKLLNPDPASRYTATQVLMHPWIKSQDNAVADDVYDEFVPRLKGFCQYSPFQRAALVAVAFCVPSSKIRRHSEVYNELNVAHNGILTLQELCDAPALKRFNLDHERIYQALDQQHEKGVNLLEFVAATLSFDDVSNDALLRRAFEIFDRHHTGGITHQDLMELLGQHFDVQACQEMVKRTDADRDGKIGFNDFAKMMKTPPRSSRIMSRRPSRSELPSGRASPTASDPGASSHIRKPRLSLSVHSASSHEVEPKRSSSVPKRRSSSPTVQALEALRAEVNQDDHHEPDSKEESVKRLQSMSAEVSRITSLSKIDLHVSPSPSSSSATTPATTTPGSVPAPSVFSPQAKLVK